MGRARGLPGSKFLILCLLKRKSTPATPLKGFPALLRQNGAACATLINEHGGKQHVSFIQMAGETEIYDLVFSFDQSFFRQMKPHEVIRTKLNIIFELGCHGMYYDSHARFLFISKKEENLKTLSAHPQSLGLPTNRLIQNDAQPSNRTEL